MHSKKRNIFKTKIAYHAYTWTALFILYSILVYFSKGEAISRVLTMSLSYIIMSAIIPVYGSYMIHDYFINRKMYLAYFIFIAAVISVSGTISHYYFTLFLGLPVMYVQWLGNAIFVVGIGIAVKVVKREVKERMQIHEIKAQQLESELALLKSQINPHFFFNTLNNLYALSLMKSDHVPGVILKLSELMRYILESSKENMVDLSREHEFLQNYLYLQKFRFTQNQNIRYDVEGDIAGKKISPMLLMPFIENSFKHGIRAVTDQFYIHIHLKVTDNYLTFFVDNSKPKEPESRPSDSIKMGLHNVKRRLELLYPDRHTLEISDKPDRYSVTLGLQI